MAEYMDIARIDDWNDLSIIDDDGWAKYVYDVGELPRADVVEREKIDKTYKEMEEFKEEVESINDLYAQSCVAQCMAILKDNVGEE